MNDTEDDVLFVEWIGGPRDGDKQMVPPDTRSIHILPNDVSLPIEVVEGRLIVRYREVE